MYEQAKIEEAHYFLEQLSALVNERDKFKFNLSGFFIGRAIGITARMQGGQK